MELTILLSQVAGIVFIVMGLAAIFRRHYINSVAIAVVEQKGVRYLVAFINLVVGLFLVLTHNDWSTLASGIISLIGWIALIKGIAYSYMSDDSLRAIIKTFSGAAWFIAAGIISLIIGIYLTGVGFAWF